ncbi:FAD-dependent oxidoreductase [Blastococcus sp. URHD0036]|uniref:FAD-dependent oxidoreductase n=1 Tax=Blastococcus sp. URHD0036 TaxID=1380356 RepID=UPI0004963ABC|nr:FAD-dependent oxidoreductase [Blastococcus sp. URHD0036]
MWATEDYDVVVVGFGTAGAAAALEAARSGARVLVLDRRGVRVRPVLPTTPGRERALRVGRRLRSRRGPAVPSPAALRADAVAAGVEVRRHTAVHELVVEGGRVTGVGFAAVDPRSVPGARYWWLDRLSTWAARPSARLSRMLRRTAESVWHDAATVGTVSAPAVVLGAARAEWDFVGPAVWAAGVVPRPAVGAVRRRLSLVGTSASVPTPELQVRAWCARETGAGTCAEALAELRVDPATGQLSVGDAGEVPGLYAAVAELTGPAPLLPEAGALQAAAGRRAGRAAAVGRPRRGHLRSVG